MSDLDVTLTEKVHMEPSGVSTAALFAAIDFTGGTLGGVATVFVGQPLDTIKVKLQTYPHMYNSSTQCFMKTLQSEGVRRGLYRGTVPSLVANIAENSVLFCAYGVCQSLISRLVGTSVNELNIWQNASAGSGAAFFSSLALCPTELIKCKLQTLSEAATEGRAAAHKNVSPYQLTRQIVRMNGVSGLFQGLSSTMLREMPGYFCFFGGYELTKSLLLQPGQSKDDLGILQTIIAGGTGGCCFWLSVFPADVIKSRIQVLPHESQVSFTQLFRQILKHEGIGALYSGILPTLLRSFPATAALFVTFESTKRLLHNIISSDTSDTAR